MLFEFIIVFELIGAIFLILGLIPFKADDTGNAYMNKIIAFIVAAIIFFSLAVSGVLPESENCYTNSSTISGDTTTYTQSCDLVVHEEFGLSAFNYGLGVLSGLLTFVSLILAGFANYNNKFME